jgi:hypothetical protein
VTEQLNLFDQEPELPADELEAIVADMERERPSGPKPERCACERSAPFRDEFGDVRCWRCGRAPR